jgi:hypothetical protein
MNGILLSLGDAICVVLRLLECSKCHVLLDGRALGEVLHDGWFGR